MLTATASTASMAAAASASRALSRRSILLFQRRSASINKKASRNDDAEMERFAAERNWADFDFLKSVRVEVTEKDLARRSLSKSKSKKAQHASSIKRVSAWDYLKSYRQGYYEKTILFDPDEAARIADAICENTQGSPEETTFFDVDGGLCQVSAKIAEKGAFKDVKVFSKDKVLRPLHRKSAEEFSALSSSLVDGDDFAYLNLNRIVADHIAELGGVSVSPLYDAMERTEWSRETPGQAVFGTATHGLVKHLAHRRLTRGASGSEFSKSRPEFFLLISPRTWFHLNSSPADSTIFQPRDALFQLTFDFELVAEVSRRAFLPWKRGKLYSDVTKVGRLYKDHDHLLFLARLRPKESLGLVETATPFHLEYLTLSLFRNKTQRVIPMMERWLPGIGVDLIRAGYDMYTHTGELASSGDALRIMNVLASHRNFGQCTLPAHAEEFRESTMRRRATAPSVKGDTLDHMRRTYAVK